MQSPEGLAPVCAKFTLNSLVLLTQDTKHLEKLSLEGRSVRSSSRKYAILLLVVTVWQLLLLGTLRFLLFALLSSQRVSSHLFETFKTRAASRDLKDMNSPEEISLILVTNWPVVRPSIMHPM